MWFIIICGERALFRSILYVTKCHVFDGLKKTCCLHFIESEHLLNMAKLNWSELAKPLDKHVLNVIKSFGFEKMTPVQSGKLKR